MSICYFLYRLRLQQIAVRIQARFEARIEERTRIAQELHDTVVQAICGSTMLVENAAEKTPDSLPVVKGSLLRAVDKLEAALVESRAALNGLRGSRNGQDDLAKQLSDLASEANVPGITLRVVTTGEPRPLYPAIQYEIFRIGSEAISNAVKHSGATILWIDIEYLNDIQLVIRDEGKGIPEQVLRSGKVGHFGLEGMRERAERIGGSLDVHSRAGAGTQVSLRVPGHIAFQPGKSSRSLTTRGLARILAFRRRRSA